MSVEMEMEVANKVEVEAEKNNNVISKEPKNSFKKSVSISSVNMNSTYENNIKNGSPKGILKNPKSSKYNNNNSNNNINEVDTEKPNNNKEIVETNKWNNGLKIWSWAGPSFVCRCFGSSIMGGGKTDENKGDFDNRRISLYNFFGFELTEKSEILTQGQIKAIGSSLPPTTLGNQWKLSFTTSRDGFSLNHLYRNLAKVNSPVLIVIQDMEKRIFGALASNPIKISTHFYGSSQCFLFRFHPEYQVYKWSGENFYFIKGNIDSFNIGSGNGKFGLWLDNNLNNGTTNCCLTFNSPPLVEEVDFKVSTLECWTY